MGAGQIGIPLLSLNPFSARRIAGRPNEKDAVSLRARIREALIRIFKRDYSFYKIKLAPFSVHAAEFKKIVAELDRYLESRKTSDEDKNRAYPYAEIFHNNRRHDLVGKLLGWRLRFEIENYVSAIRLNYEKHREDLLVRILAIRPEFTAEDIRKILS